MLRESSQRRLPVIQPVTAGTQSRTATGGACHDLHLPGAGSGTQPCCPTKSSADRSAQCTLATLKPATPLPFTLVPESSTKAYRGFPRYVT
jgi:hypothetical protein